MSFYQSFLFTGDVYLIVNPSWIFDYNQGFR